MGGHRARGLADGVTSKDAAFGSGVSTATHVPRHTVRGGRREGLDFYCNFFWSLIFKF